MCIRMGYKECSAVKRNPCSRRPKSRSQHSCQMDHNCPQCRGFEPLFSPLEAPTQENINNNKKSLKHSYTFLECQAINSRSLSSLPNSMVCSWLAMVMSVFFFPTALNTSLVSTWVRRNRLMSFLPKTSMFVICLHSWIGKPPQAVMFHNYFSPNMCC